EGVCFSGAAALSVKEGGRGFFFTDPLSTTSLRVRPEQTSMRRSQRPDSAYLLSTAPVGFPSELLCTTLTRWCTRWKERKISPVVHRRKLKSRRVSHWDR